MYFSYIHFCVTLSDDRINNGAGRISGEYAERAAGGYEELNQKT